MIKHWTAEEESTFAELKEQGYKLREIAEKLGRTLESVRTRSKRLAAQGKIPKSGNRGNSTWTDAEVGTLYNDMDYDELAEALGKTRRAVEAKCQKLGISKRFAHTNTSSGTMYADRLATLYLVDFGRFKKVGVTQVNLLERFKQDCHLLY